VRTIGAIPSARRALSSAPATLGLVQLVPGDPVQPAPRRLGSQLIARTRFERRGEGLGREVVCQLGAAHAAAEESEHTAYMAAVEDRERLGIARRRGEQLAVGARV
jgi:hypothetical protein